MQILYPRCCGLDIHKRSIVACVLADTATGSVDREVRTFGTTTRERQALVTCPQTWHCPIVAMESTSVSKQTYLAAQYRRLSARRRGKKAVVAVGHSILVIAYHLLTRQDTYRELGETHFAQRERQAVERRLVKRL